jgi:phage gpG-like protein
MADSLIQVSVDLSQVENAPAWFSRMPESLRRHLRPAIIDLTRNLALRVRANLTGLMLRIVTGQLIGSIRQELIEDPTTIGGRVYTKGVPYARILHFGGQTRPHVITARRARALRFQFNGATVFFRQVNHPGSRFPPRPYIHQPLEQMREQITARLTAAGAAAAGAN